MGYFIKSIYNKKLKWNALTNSSITGMIIGLISIVIASFGDESYPFELQKSWLHNDFWCKYRFLIQTLLYTTFIVATYWVFSFRLQKIIKGSFLGWVHIYAFCIF